MILHVLHNRTKDFGNSKCDNIGSNENIFDFSLANIVKEIIGHKNL